VADVSTLVVAWATVFVVNLAPALMPPTWSILAFFLIRDGAPLLPLALGGAVAATVGRLTLALASRRWGTRLLDPGRREGLARLGRLLEERARLALPLAVLLYSFGPIPSNELFIAAGLTRVRLAPIVAAFLTGRLVSYTLWAAGAHAVVDRLDDVFVGYWRNAGAVAVQLALLAVLVIFARLDWVRILDRGHAGARPPGEPR